MLENELEVQESRSMEAVERFDRLVNRSLNHYRAGLVAKGDQLGIRLVSTD